MINTNDDFLEQMFSDPSTTPSMLNDDKGFEDSPEITSDETEEPEDAPEAPREVLEDNDPVVENYVKFLQENDLIEIPEDYDFQGTPDQIQEVFEYTKKTRSDKAIQSVFQQLPDDFKPLLEYALRGGTSLQDYMDTFSDDLSNYGLDTEEDQKEILFKYYKETSPYPDDKIERLISRFNDEEELRLEAADAYQELLQIREEKKRELIVEAQAQREAYRADLEQKTISLNKAIEETTAIHPQRKNKVRAFFFDPIQTANSVTTGFNATIASILSNPEHQAQLADILLDYNHNNGFSSDRIERRVKTKATQDFKTLLKTKLDPKQAQRSSTSRAPQSTSFNWEDYSQSL